MDTDSKKMNGEGDSVFSTHCSGPSCPREELLLAYLCGRLPDDEGVRIDVHLRACDDCLYAVEVAQQRLGIAADVAMAIPKAVWQRLEGHSVFTMPGDESRYTPQRSIMRYPLSVLHRLGMLAPMALAVVALLVVATRYTGWHS